jgi:riboflavin biosynthesis pyrimidine reductase
VTLLSPLEVLFDVSPQRDYPLPESLTALYGPLGFPTHSGRPHVTSNFVSTLDGVVSLGLEGKTDGDEISGFNRHDSMVMGLLRAVSDAVIIGAGSLRKSSRHIWTAEHVYPPLSSEYGELRQMMGMNRAPLNVFVTSSGNIDPSLPVFHAESLPILIVTTADGAEELRKREMPDHIRVVTAGRAQSVVASDIVHAVKAMLSRCNLILVEGGPRLMGHFLAEGQLDELFLTLAPQIAGRDANVKRLGLVADKIFTPDQAVWGNLLSVRRAGEHLFLRYGFRS